MADRYFVEAPIDGTRASLVGSEAHHLAHVMRAKPGDAVVLFDGSGVQFEARVASIGRSEIELEVLAREAVARELPIRVTLGVALPKGDRQRWLVEKAAELGVARLVPLIGERAGEHQSESSLGRLRRAVIEASKQCGRNRLMEVSPQQTLPVFLSDQRPDSLRWFAQPGGTPIGELLPALPAEFPPGVVIAIGPEGGFTDAEVAAATAHGWQPVDLGKRILRIETAALAVVAAVVAHVEAS